MNEYRHVRGPQPCGQIACYAPDSLFEPPDDRLPLGRVTAGGWASGPVLGSTSRIAPFACGTCGQMIGSGALEAQLTTMVIIVRRERRVDALRRGVALTSGILTAHRDGPCMTAKQIATFLAVDARAIGKEMESGAIANAFRQGHRGGVGEWRCPWIDGVHYLERQVKTALAS
jgi:hypothetical protein